jgi:Cobalamin-5-phosphate synthase
MSSSSSAPKIESRTCSAYDIPIESRTCSAYDISIAKKSDETTTSTTSTSNSSDDLPNKSKTLEDDNNASSVIDKSEVSSRGILQQKEGMIITRDQVNDEIRSFLHAPLTLRQEQRSFLTIVMFLTRLPVPTTVDLHPGFLMKGMCYLPVVGMFIGIAVATTYDLIVETCQLPSTIAAIVSIGMGWILTGCFHEDGLSDSADGE